MKYYRKDWILFQEVANEGGKVPETFKETTIKSDDPDKNKHVPYIEETNDGYKVKVGKNEFHATDSEHHTMFIELVVDNQFYYKKIIKLNEKPEADFKINKGKEVKAYAFCNLHGLFEYKM